MSRPSGAGEGRIARPGAGSTSPGLGVAAPGYTIWLLRSQDIDTLELDSSGQNKVYADS